MAKSSRTGSASSKARPTTARKIPARAAVKTPAPARPAPEPVRGWATDLVFDVREPKLAVSLRLDADVLRFFRGFGAGYQTRINEVLKAFMQARGGAETASRPASAGRGGRAAASGKSVV